MPIVGVNEAGAEFGAPTKLPGNLGQTHIYPRESDLDHFLDLGIKLIRLPFRQERVQHKQGVLIGGGGVPNDGSTLGNLAQSARENLAELDKVVAYVQSRGGITILDAHNYARYVEGGTAKKWDEGVTREDFADFWKQMAGRYRDKAVWFDLQNEPNGVSAETVREFSRAAIAAIRSTGANQRILVEGTDWTGAHSWLAHNGPAFAGFITPDMGDVIYEMHQYGDSDSSGRSEIISDTIIVERLQKATAWLRAEGAKAMLGEFGFTQSDRSQRGLKNLLAYLEANKDVWVAHTIWAAGPWWGSYLYSVQPSSDGTAKPQTFILMQYADGTPQEPPQEPPTEPPTEPPPTEPPTEPPPSEPPSEPPTEPPQEPPTEPPSENERLSISLEKRGGEWKVVALRQ